MGLYDIINEMSERQIVKSETGDQRINGLMVGIVARNYDKDMPGRVCVTIPTRDESANELKWARMALNSGGPKWGTYFLPEIGDQVLLGFEGGNIERPYVLGCLSKDNDSFLSGSADEHNQVKRIVTKHGSTITFNDHKEDEKGLKDSILVQTAEKKHTVLLDNENSLIRISDETGSNIIEMTTAEDHGTLTIKVTNNLSIKVGDTITLTMNGDSGAVKLEANQVNIETSKGTTLKSDARIALEGAQMALSGSSSFTAESGGSTKIDGKVIKIG